MNGLDVIIIILALGDAIRGATIGFARQFFSFSGFWGGLFVAALIAPLVSSYGHTPVTKLALIVGTILIIATILSTIGEYIGAYLATFVHRLKIGPIDTGLGAIFGVVLVVLSTWVVTAMLASVPIPALSEEIQTSIIVRQIDALFPPAPPIVARIQRLINLNGFPQVFVGPEPKPGIPSGAATTPEVASAVAADRASVVQIEGIGCGGEVFGSGFIAGPGYVITNAHVVAGITAPEVVANGYAQRAVPVYFNPSLDLAVLHVSSLSGAPLPISIATAPNNTHAIVMGYPGGGPFTASPGSVIENFIATGRNIYNSGITARQVYEISADVEPGNSGGPLVLPDGTVIGVVFARSEVAGNVGYALLTPPVVSDLHQAETSRTTVGTGSCATE